MKHVDTRNTDRKGAVTDNKPFDVKAVTQAVKEGIARAAAAQNMDELKAVKTQYAGAQSVMTLASKAIGSLPADQKKEVGKVMSTLRADFGRAFAQASERVKSAEEARMLSAETVDMTLPVNRKPPVSYTHLTLPTICSV